MNRIFTILILTVIFYASHAQYNNEWINYSNTYYKFKVGKTGLYRITQSNLPAVLQNASVDQFQLWRNGKQIAIYTSVQSGILPSGGYIEFEGFQNDGEADRALYKNPANQLSTALSLETDTAVYFLTINSSGNNLRIVDAANTITGNPAPQASFIYDYRRDFKNQINPGKAIYAGEPLYSGTYDVGEFWSSNEGNPITDNAQNLFVAPGTTATLSFSVANNSYYVQSLVSAQINNTTVITAQPLPFYSAAVFSADNISLPANTAITASIRRDNNATGRIVAGFIDLKYSRQFNFGGSSNFQFSLPASTGNYFEVSGFTSSSIPVLYDLSNNKRYTAVASGSIYKFALPASALDRNLVLVSEDAPMLIQTFTQRNFTDYAASSATEGNYLIVSNKILGITSGAAVDNYRAYRITAAGGNYNAKIYDIDDLIDQFAFGIKKHPLGVKNFVRYANAKFAVKPQVVFIIGKGVVYDQYRLNESSPDADLLNLVPTFGDPASDALLTSDDYKPLPAVLYGRLSVVKPQEVNDYLQKIKDYESVQQDTASGSQTLANKGWMKNIAHVVGADDAGTNSEISGDMAVYKNIIQGPSFGGNVTTFNKLTSSQGNSGTTAALQQLFSNGMSLLNYFGHGSATELDFALNDVTLFTNPKKYPVFFVNGCNTGNVYAYDASRLSQITSISESYVQANDRGSVAVVAGSNFGIASYLHSYITGFYNSLANQGYDKPVGNNMLAGSAAILSATYLDSTTRYIHAEQEVLNGDPALKVNANTRPDYDVEQSTIFLSPSQISVNDAGFTVKVFFYNLGKAQTDSVPVVVKWRLPDGSTQILYSGKRSFLFEDSVIVAVPIIGSKDKGTNFIDASIGYADNNQPVFSEITLVNNISSKQFLIYSDELTPVYPYDYAIISKSSGKVYASTANVLAPAAQYIMQMDTTTFFNSPLLIQKTITSTGGLIEFDPGIIYQDSVVYYWRTAPVPSNGIYTWNTSSFVYLGGTQDGFNQSHLYQHLNSGVQHIYIDSFSRKWNFTRDTQSITLNNAYYSPVYHEDINFSVQLNTIYITTSACVGHSIIFNVFDPLSLKPLYNQSNPSVVPSGGPYGGFMGSYPVACNHIGTQFNFEFKYNDVQSRNKMASFMNWISSGYLVTARIILDTPFNDNQTFAPYWKNDPPVNGTNLYQSLVSAGFLDLDSFYYPRTWVFAYEKNNASFKPFYKLTQNLNDFISSTIPLTAVDSTGTVTSPVFGPAVAWKNVLWNGYSVDAGAGDRATVDVIGITPSGAQQILYNLSTSQQNFDISSVSVSAYPYIQLRMHNSDSIHFTPYQLRWWRLYYTPVPEGALAPNLNSFLFPDTLNVGAPLPIAIPFKNISDVSFADTINVLCTVYDKNNAPNNILIKALKKLAPGDTAMIVANIDTQNYTGLNNFYLDVNPLAPPNLHQPEQYHSNNFLYQNFLVNTDNYNPLLDVTFDGIHILNNDIVSAKPLITIKLKSQSEFLLLNDTSMITVSLQYPDGTIQRYPYDNNILRFEPATAGGVQNVAAADFSPLLIQDGLYKLLVSGKDAKGNSAGAIQYTVTFEVINKPMITNMFNYPNPFTTSTAFVFTITGSQIPQNIRIEILTITGKIVRELTESDLGPLHIGRNITQYRWDGTDMYGSKLANGVYIYRVLTNLNNQSLSKFPTYDSHGNEVNTDQYFNKGYGKMYLMR